jgi:hypothetical protein
MAKMPTPEYTEIVALLEAWAINPNDVPEFGVTRQGYQRFRRNAFTGKILIDPATESAQVDFCEWPAGFPVDRLFHFLGQGPE